MLMLGTADHLEDLDRELTLAEDASVTSLAAREGRDGAVYALLDNERLVRVNDADVTPLASLLGAQSMAAVESGLVVGHEGAHVSIVAIPTMEVSSVASFDTVQGRDGWDNPAGSSPDLRSIAVLAGSSWFVNVHVGGVWRSDDGGTSWAEVIPKEADVHEIAAVGNVLVVAAARGFAHSEDGGRTWRWTTTGLHGAYCRAAALDGDVAYVTASTGPRTEDGRLYRGRLGESFEACDRGLPGSFPFNLDTGTLTARGGEVAVGTSDGQVYRSGDGGGHFELVAEGRARVTVLRFC